MKIELKVTKSLLYLFLSYFTVMCGLLQLLAFALYDHLLSYMSFYGHMLLFIVFYGGFWSCMAFYGLLWSYMAFYGHNIVLYGLSWQNIDLNGLVSSFLAVIDPNSFSLVFTTIEWVSLKLCL